MAVRHTGRDRGDLVVWLEPALNEPTNTPAELAVPDQVRNPHPFIGAIRCAKTNKNGWIDTTRDAGVARVRVHRASRTRTVRILHAIALEALRRGHALTTPSSNGSGLRVLIGSHSTELAVIEETDKEPHTPTKADLAQAARSPWFQVPEWDRVPSGRLVLRDSVGTHSTTLASDRKRWTLEDRLGKALDIIEEHALQAEQRRLEAEALAVERHHRWEIAMANARTEFAEDRRRRHLLAQLEDWELAERLERFLAAVSADNCLEAGSAEWIDWAKTYATNLNPVRSGLSGPAIPDPTNADLQPFLAGLSPFGPNSR